MKVKRILDISVYDEYLDEKPSSAEIVITPEFVERVKELNEAVKKLEVYKIVEFDYRPDWFYEDENEKIVPWEEGTIDTVMLNVSSDDIMWSGYIKHTSILIETGSISLSELLEIDKVINTPPKDLPLLINSLEYNTAKEACEQRLRE